MRLGDRSRGVDKNMLGILVSTVGRVLVTSVYDTILSAGKSLGKESLLILEGDHHPCFSSLLLLPASPTTMDWYMYQDGFRYVFGARGFHASHGGGFCE